MPDWSSMVATLLDNPDPPAWRSFAQSCHARPPVPRDLHTFKEAYKRWKHLVSGRPHGRDWYREWTTDCSIQQETPRPNCRGAYKSAELAAAPHRILHLLHWRQISFESTCLNESTAGKMLPKLETTVKSMSVKVYTLSKTIHTNRSI